MQGHSEGELWGLSAHPTSLDFVTASEDKTVRSWSLTNKVRLVCTHVKFSSHRKKKLSAIVFKTSNGEIDTVWSLATSTFLPHREGVWATFLRIRGMYIHVGYIYVQYLTAYCLQPEQPSALQQCRLQVCVHPVCIPNLPHFFAWLARDMLFLTWCSREECCKGVSTTR